VLSSNIRKRIRKKKGKQDADAEPSFSPYANGNSGFSVIAQNPIYPKSPKSQSQNASSSPSPEPGWEGKLAV
jgi:hypothetical protein